jgi:hypothetical protein
MTAARRSVRALPSVLVAALVVVAAAAQSGPSNPFRRLLPAKSGASARTAAAASASASGDRTPAPAGIAVTSCRTVTPSASSSPPAPEARLVQPDVVTITAATLSIVVGGNTGSSLTFTAELGFYDPDNATDPRLGSYALQKSTLTATGAGPEVVAVALDRPIVVRELEPDPTTPTAGFWFQSGADGPLDALYDPDGPSDHHPAFWDLGPGAMIPLQGANPVLAHEVCGDSPGDDGLYVLRQVIRSDVVVTPTAQLVQTFAVGVTTTAQWIELAIALPPGTTAPRCRSSTCRAHSSPLPIRSRSPSPRRFFKPARSHRRCGAPRSRSRPRHISSPVIATASRSRPRGSGRAAPPSRRVARSTPTATCGRAEDRAVRSRSRPTSTCRSG